jgi:hypothetical protein
MAGNLARGAPCAACLSTALIPVTLVTASRRLARGKGIIVRLGVATLSLSFLLLAGASVHAQAPPPAPPEASRPTPGIAQSFVNWLHHVAGVAPQRRERSMPPLPRPRPAELAATSNAPDNAPAAQLHSLGLRNQQRRLSRLRPHLTRRIRRHLRMQRIRRRRRKLRPRPLRRMRNLRPRLMRRIRRRCPIRQTTDNRKLATSNAPHAVREPLPAALVRRGNGPLFHRQG